MPRGMEIGFGPGDFVLDGDRATLPKKVAEPPPRFSVHVYCSQTAGWIKMALGMKVDLGLHDIVLGGNPAPSPLRGTAPNFWPMFIAAKRGAVPLGRGSWIPNRHRTQCGQGRGPWSTCVPSFIWIHPTVWPPIHQRCRQTARAGQSTDRQRSDSIGRTVLQTVAQ